MRPNACSSPEAPLPNIPALSSTQAVWSASIETTASSLIQKTVMYLFLFN